jgi:hypothetical protein
MEISDQMEMLQVTEMKHTRIPAYRGSILHRNEGQCVKVMTLKITSRILPILSFYMCLPTPVCRYAGMRSELEQIVNKHAL